MSYSSWSSHVPDPEHVYSDLWVADVSCETGCDGVATFNPATSTSFDNLNQPFEVNYGSGSAMGTLGSDVIQMAGFSVSKQTFGARSSELRRRCLY